MRACHVSTCEEKDIPEGLKGSHQQESFIYKVRQIYYSVMRAQCHVVIDIAYRQAKKKKKKQKQLMNRKTCANKRFRLLFLYICTSVCKCCQYQYFT